MAKLLGACFILMASYLFGVKIMERDAEHIRLLEEGELLYRILESEIRIQEHHCPFYLEN